MANQIGEGQWQGLDGKIYASEGEANTQSGNVVLNNTGGGGGAMPGMVGGLAAIVIFGPILFAKLVSFLWGLLLKLGIVGRVLTTGLMLIAGPFMAMIIMGLSQELFRGLGRVGSGIVIVSAALLPAAWYFLWHYDAVKLMGASTFSAKIGNFAKFVWFGSLGACILAFFKSNEALRAVISIGASIAGIVFYLISTKKYAREASQNPTIRIPLAVKGIVMAAVVGLIVIYGIAAKNLVDTENVSRNIEQEGGIAALPANNSAQRKIAARYTAGKTITWYSGCIIYAEPSNKSTIIKEFIETTTLVSTGNVLFIPGTGGRKGWLGYVSVKHNGVEGWLYMSLKR